MILNDNLHVQQLIRKITQELNNGMYKKKISTLFRFILHFQNIDMI
jgi:hypothetical protein